MIQRIQSIFLLVAAIAAFSVIFLPIWDKTDAATAKELELTALSLNYQEGGNPVQTKSTIAIAILAGLGSIVALGSLFSYKDRMKQMKLNLLNSFVLAGCVGAMAYYFYTSAAMFSPSVQGNFSAGFFMPLVALLCNSMANRFIRRDEKLVKSVDRLR